MTTIDWIYVIAFLLLLGGEIYALVVDNKTDGKESQTISHKTIKWLKKNPGFRRTVLIIFLLWLIYHLGFQQF